MDENNIITDELNVAEEQTSQRTSGKFGKLMEDASGTRKLTGMYKNWFLDYASYVILERAVPHV